MNLPYLINILKVVILSPWLLKEGKKIRKSVPKLPEAKDLTGFIGPGEQRSLHLLAIGESTIAGVGVRSHKDGITGHLARQISRSLTKSISWTVLAKSGFRVQEVNKILVPRLPQESPDLIIIGLGGNDTFKFTKPQKWKSENRKLINHLRKKYPADIPIVYCNLPPVNQFPAFSPLVKYLMGNQTDILGDILTKLVKHHPSVYFLNDKIEVDEWNARSGATYSMEDFFSDGVHPSGLTYQLLAEEVSTFIEEKELLR